MNLLKMNPFSMAHFKFTAFNIYIIFLKLTLSVQLFLIFIKKHSETSIIFIVSNMLFKISLGIFLMSFFVLNKVTEIDNSDKVVIAFAGVILIYDAVFIDLPKAFQVYNINFSPYTLIQSAF